MTRLARAFFELLPPVPEGHTRYWRGTNKNTGPETHQGEQKRWEEFDRQHGIPNQESLDFALDFEYAGGFAGSFSHGGCIFYLDVPDDASPQDIQYDFPNSSEEIEGGFVRVLNPEFAKRAVDVTGFAHTLEKNAGEDMLRSLEDERDTYPGREERITWATDLDAIIKKYDL